MEGRREAKGSSLAVSAFRSVSGHNSGGRGVGSNGSKGGIVDWFGNVGSSKSSRSRLLADSIFNSVSASNLGGGGGGRVYIAKVNHTNSCNAVSVKHINNEVASCE